MKSEQLQVSGVALYPFELHHDNHWISRLCSHNEELMLACCLYIQSEYWTQQSKKNLTLPLIYRSIK